MNKSDFYCKNASEEGYKQEYRIAMPAVIGFTIIATSEKEAVEKANKWREEMSDINGGEYQIIDEDDVIGASVAAFNVAVYADKAVGMDDIESVDEMEDLK